MDMLVAPYNDMGPDQIEVAAGQVPVDGELRLQMAGEDDVGNPREFVALLPLAAGASGKERLEAAGLELAELDGAIVVDNVAFSSVAEKAGFEFDQKILKVRVPAKQPAKEWLWIPALAVLALIAFAQRRRRKTEVVAA